MEGLENVLGMSSQFGSETMSNEEIQELSKALLAPETRDELYETSGGVTTMQDLEGMLADLTLNENDFTLWKDINKIKGFSTVEEYDQKLGHGISDGGFVGQIENPEFRDPVLAKEIAIVKYMSEGWQVGDVSANVRKIVDEKAVQQRSAMMRLLRNVNMAFYNADSSLVPKSFDGLEKTISGQSSDNIRDLRGNDVDQSVFDLVAQIITDFNGNPENARVYASPSGIKSVHDILNGSRDTSINNYIINSGDKNVTVGSTIRNIQTPFGNMKLRTDKLLGLCYENKIVPQRFNETSKVFEEAKTSEKAPDTPTVSLTVNATETGSLFAATGVRPSGAAYRYRVSAKNEYGRSIASAIVTAGGNVATGGSIDVEITPASTGNQPTCFEIYSEKAAGSGEFRYLGSIAANGASQVVYTDKNDIIPGTARMFIIDQTSVGESRVMAFSQLLPIHNTDLAKVGRYVHGLINLYGVPKYYKPNVLVEIRNINVDQTSVNRYNLI